MQRRIVLNRLSNSCASFVTLTRDGSEWSVSVALGLGKDPELSIEQEAGWAPNLAWTLQRGENLLPLLGIEPRFFSRPHSSLLTPPTEQ